MNGKISDYSSSDFSAEAYSDNDHHAPHDNVTNKIILYDVGEPIVNVLGWTL